MKTRQKTSGKTSETKSQRGTKCTGTSKKYKLLGIIDGCRKLGVSKIKTPEFEVEFFLERSQEVGSFVDPIEQTKPTAIDRELLNDVRLSQLMIDDPFSFEKEVIEAEQRRLMNEAVQN